jgi:hypothetical protein
LRGRREGTVVANLDDTFRKEASAITVVVET